jgi:hypothetical protein
MQGNLDGRPFRKVSCAGSGASRFVIKGFGVDCTAVKFSCPWGRLSAGRVFYLPDGALGWREVSGARIALAGPNLRLSFDLPQDDFGHTAEFCIF